MKWEKVRLGDVTDSCLGKMLDQNKNKGEYQPYLANVNVRWGSFDLDDLPVMRFEDREQERYGLEYGDLIICEGGEPGRCAIWKNQIPHMKIQKALHRVRVHKEMDFRFLYYWFYFAGKRNALDQYFTGATIKHMPGDKLKSIIIDNPPIEVQTRIADILSAYDDLIENNQKQIKLLEEAAQRLYKEWFVDLRFPGHEHTAIVDGVPEGWTYSEIDSVFSIRYGKTLPTSKISSTGKYPVYGANGIIGYYDEKNCDDYSVLITSRGNGSGDVLRTYDKESFITNNSFIVKALNENIGFSYTHQLMVHTDFKNIRTGSAQPQLTNNSISTLKIFIPSNTLIDHYCLSTDAIYKKIIVLLKQIRLATQARDRLLPKLMSGEMEV